MMRTLLLFIPLLLCMNGLAQSGFAKPHPFLRVYDLEGKKIGKGKLLSTSESGLQLTRYGKTATFPFDQIGSLKTNRSAGNNILIGAASGAVIFGVLGAATADPDDLFFGMSSGEGAIMGIAGGAPFGAAIGGLTSLFKKNSNSFDIYGDGAKWRAFRELMGD